MQQDKKFNWSDIMNEFIRLYPGESYFVRQVHSIMAL